MKRKLVPVAVLLLAACGTDPQVVVRASLAEGGQPIVDLPVRLLPYDRTELLDSLARAYGKPEPEIPQDLIQRLADTSSAPITLPVAEGDTTPPRVLTREQLRPYLDSLRTEQRRWADSAYAGYDEAVRERAAALGRGERADTTDASGTARIPAGDGAWWVWAQYTTTDRQLDWVVPVELPEEGDSVVVALTPANAKVRPFF